MEDTPETIKEGENAGIFLSDNKRKQLDRAMAATALNYHHPIVSNKTRLRLLMGHSSGKNTSKHWSEPETFKITSRARKKSKELMVQAATPVDYMLAKATAGKHGSFLKNNGFKLAITFASEIRKNPIPKDIAILNILTGQKSIYLQTFSADNAQSQVSISINVDGVNKIKQNILDARALSAGNMKELC